MDDKSRIEAQYREMYRAMIAKDTTALDAVLDEQAVLIHMTGLRQPKHEYIRAIAGGTLNYYQAEVDETIINVDGYKARMIGRSRVTAAVFGGGQGTWRLQLDCTLIKRDGRWLFQEMKASTY